MLHDTFAWLVLYWRSFGVLWLVALANAALMVWGDVDLGREHGDLLVMLARQLFPFCQAAESLSPQRMAWAYALATALTTLTVSPLLIRYFVDRRTLRRMTLRKAFSEMSDKWTRALAAAAIMGLLCYGLCMLNVVLMLLVMVLVTVVVADVLMWRKPDSLNFRRGGFIISTVLMLALLFSIVQALPMLSGDLIDTCIDLLNRILPGVIGEKLFITRAIDLLVLFAYGVSYSAAVTLYLVGAIMLHGAIYPEHAD